MIKILVQRFRLCSWHCRHNLRRNRYEGASDQAVQSEVNNGSACRPANCHHAKKHVIGGQGQFAFDSDILIGSQCRSRSAPATRSRGRGSVR